MAVVVMTSCTGVVRMSPRVSWRRIGNLCAANGAGASGTTVVLSPSSARPASPVYNVTSPVCNTRTPHSWLGVINEKCLQLLKEKNMTKGMEKTIPDALPCYSSCTCVTGGEGEFPIRLTGTVVKGFGRGSKQMGIPTANIDPDEVSEEITKLRKGVYFGWAQIKGSGLDDGVYKMVMNIGKRPTFADGDDVTVQITKQTEGSSPYLVNISVGILLYEGDIILMSRTPEGLQKYLNILEQVCKKLGLSVNIKKSEIMVFGTRLNMTKQHFKFYFT